MSIIIVVTIIRKNKKSKKDNCTPEPNDELREEEFKEFNLL